MGSKDLEKENIATRRYYDKNREQILEKKKQDYRHKSEIRAARQIYANDYRNTNIRPRRIGFVVQIDGITVEEIPAEIYSMDHQHKILVYFRVKYKKEISEGRHYWVEKTIKSKFFMVPKNEQ